MELLFRGGDYVCAGQLAAAVALWACARAFRGTPPSTTLQQLALVGALDALM